MPVVALKAKAIILIDHMLISNQVPGFLYIDIIAHHSESRITSPRRDYLPKEVLLLVADGVPLMRAVVRELVLDGRLAKMLLYH
jgi:hypothetical protein